MVENKNSDDHQRNSDYAHALEILHEVSESAVQALGHEAIEHAEAVTYAYGVTLPQRIQQSAESITYLAGVAGPRQTIEEAERITAHDAEIISVGEDLKESEDEGLAHVAASRVLHDHAMRAAFRNQRTDERLKYFDFQDNY